MSLLPNLPRFSTKTLLLIILGLAIVAAWIRDQSQWQSEINRRRSAETALSELATWHSHHGSLYHLPQELTPFIPDGVDPDAGLYVCPQPSLGATLSVLTQEDTHILRAFRFRGGSALASRLTAQWADNDPKELMKINVPLASGDAGREGWFILQFPAINNDAMTKRLVRFSVYRNGFTRQATDLADKLPEWVFDSKTVLQRETSYTLGPLTLKEGQSFLVWGEDYTTEGQPTVKIRFEVFAKDFVAYCCE